jgi:DUF1009 family protein
MPTQWMKRIGLIAGSGQFPKLFSKPLLKKGFSVYTAAYVNEADQELTQLSEKIQWLHLGQVKRLIKFFKQNNVNRAVMFGAVRKTRLFTDVKPDMKAISIIAGMRHTHDDAIMRAFADSLEKEGIKIEPSTFLLPELLATKGIWTKRKPSRSGKKRHPTGAFHRKGNWPTGHRAKRGCRWRIDSCR